MSILDEYDSGRYVGIGGLFKAAERKYREALSLAPSLLEARLRLGRVLALTNRVDEARILLERVRRESPGGHLGYLADLFLGDVCERVGMREAASACYEAAIHEYPDCQTAYLALGRLQELTGDRERSSATVRDLFGGEGRGNPQHDPWWAYWYAQYWQIDARMADLRARVRR
jgi:tetratricopeptide (TPR) repeat protein